MLISSVPSRRRGISSSAVFAGLVAVVLIFVVGFVVGRQFAPNQTVKPDVTTKTKATSGETQGSIVTKASNTAPEAGTATTAAIDDIPPFKIDPPELDFGFIDPGQELHGTIQVTNVSDKPLTVTKQASTCKCTVAQDITGMTLAPGESVELNPVVEPRSWNGPKRDKITLVFAGYPKPASIVVKSNVAQAVYAEPPYLNAARSVNAQGTIDVETPQELLDRMTGTIKLLSRNETPFRLLALNGGEVPYVDFDPAQDEPRSSYELQWDLTPYNENTCVDVQGNKMRGWWVVETDHPEAPVVDLRVRHLCTIPKMPVRADISGRHWFPKDFRTVLGELKAGEPIEFEITLKWMPHAKKDDTIVNVISKTDQFSILLLDTWNEEEVTKCRVELIPDKNHRGLLYGNCELFGTQPGHSAETMIIARVAE